MGTATPPSGRSASRNGRQLETLVVSTFQLKGFPVVPYRKWAPSPGKYGSEVLVRNVPYTTIYRLPGKTEFVLHSGRYPHPVRIECKWQQENGSVDEKFPYVYLNALAMPEPEILLLIDGGGAKPGAINWLKAKAMENNRARFRLKVINVLNLSEFVAWANRTFP